jgi:hypothetical protein
MTEPAAQAPQVCVGNDDRVWPSRHSRAVNSQVSSRETFPVNTFYRSSSASPRCRLRLLYPFFLLFHPLLRHPHVSTRRACAPR